MRALMLATALPLVAVGAAIGVAVATHSNSVDVRVAARSTESDSIEFAIQQRLPDGSWSDYRYGRARFFGPSLHDGRWKHATPVQVEVLGVHVATAEATPAPTSASTTSVRDNWSDDSEPLNDDASRVRLGVSIRGNPITDPVNRSSGARHNGFGLYLVHGGTIGNITEEHETHGFIGSLGSGYRQIGSINILVSTTEGYYFIGCREYWLNGENIRTITRSQCDFLPRRWTSSGIDLTHYDDRYELDEIPNNLLVNGGTNTLCVDTQVVDEQYWIDRSISENNRTLSLMRFIREHMDEIPVERFCFDFKVVW